MFHVGQKVVCIFPGPWINSRGESFIVDTPILNTVYTIRGFLDIKGIDLLGVYLNEITNPEIDCGLLYGWLEPAWLHSNFRKIIERKTDISVFQKMLTPELVE